MDRARMYAAVALTVKDLTLDELAALNNTVAWDADPRGRLFDYEKVKSLFTEGDGLRMHDATKDALAEVVLKRLASG